MGYLVLRVAESFIGLKPPLLWFPLGLRGIAVREPIHLGEAQCTLVGNFDSRGTKGQINRTGRVRNA